MKQIIKPKTPKREIRQDRWLTTFGDLLTLILCFFLSLITANGQKISKLVIKEEHQFHGTQFADKQGVKRRTWLSFRSDELEEAVFKAALVSKLDKLAKGKALEMTRVFVESCDFGGAAYQELNWHHSMSQALAVRSQIIDVLPKVEAAAVMLRAVGSSCDVLTQAEKDSVVMIGIETKHKV